MKIKASIPFFRASLHLEITSLKYFNITISHANYACIKYLWYTRHCALWRKKRDMKCIIIFRKADSQSEQCGLSVYKLCQVFLFLKKKHNNTPHPSTLNQSVQVYSKGFQMSSISQDLFRWLWPTLSLRTTCLLRWNGSKMLTSQVKLKGMSRITKGQKVFVGLIWRKKMVRIKN